MKHLVVVVSLVLLASTAAAQNAAVTISIDATAPRRVIDPRIYGLNFASQQQLADLNVTLNRSGGNAATRYNWQANASSRADDWFYQSIGEASATAGENADTFIALSRAANAQPMITIPIIGWVAKLGPNRGKLASFSIAKYGAQQANDWQWMPDAGNGKRPNGSLVTGNDPHDANMPADAQFQRAWVQHLVNKWGTAANGGLRYYILDNEHSIWHGTHRDVHPTGATMQEVRDKMIAHALEIKSVDPGALTVGPEEWGWSGFLMSGYDQQYGAQTGQWGNLPDRAAHGGRDYMPWLLDELRLASARNGKHVLDVFTLHYYPQGGEYSNTTTEAMQLRRNRSTRSLWDPSYVDETWINDEVRLIPRMREWVDQWYPGLTLGITEYNWGAESHMNGATTQADIFGIFGREGLDLATRWTTPDTGTPAYNAIKLYRNYDGAKSAFGDISVSTSTATPDNVSAFGAVRTADQSLTIMIVSKALSGDTPVTVNFANFNAVAANAQRWQLASNTISHLADVVRSGNSLSLTVPPQSVTLLVLPGTTDTTLPALAITSAGTSAITGTASDNAGVASVKYKLVGAASVVTGTATGTTSWSIPTQGKHWRHVIVTAYDTSGNPKTVVRQLAEFVVSPGGPGGRRRTLGR